MKLGAALCLGLVLIASPAASANEQFDLICEGATKSVSRTGTDVQSWKRRYSFDLAQSKYCEGACRGIFDIVKVNPGSIVINDDLFDDSLGRGFMYVYINRETGEFVGDSETIYPDRNIPPLTIEWRGTCEVHPFSGFDRLPTKF